MTVTDTQPPTETTEPPPPRVSPTTNQAMELRSLDDKLRYADEVSGSFLLPKEYRGRPANVLYAIEYGAMLGLHPIAAINNIHVIEGKASAAASLLQALARKAGHKVRIWATRDERGLPVGHCEIYRSDDPDFAFAATFTIDDAVTAKRCTLEKGKDGVWKVISKGQSGNPTSWETYPRSMVKHRALSECVRDACQEAMLGVMYTPEELGAEVDEDGNLVAYPAGSEEAAREMRAEAFDSQHHGTVIQAEVVEDEPEADDDTKRAWLMAEMAEMANIVGVADVTEVTGIIASRIDMAKGGSHTAEMPAADIDKILTEATPEEIIRVVGQLRPAMVARLLNPEGKTPEEAKADKATAHLYRSRGQRIIASPLDLFGHDGRPAPHRNDAQNTAESTAENIAEETPEPAPGGPEAGDGAGVEPHPFDSREDDPDACAECNHPAQHQIHDPLHGV